MSHAHHHSHHHTTSYNAAFAMGVALNITFVAIEVGYGIVADSLALIADAGHNLSDVLSLLLVWGAHFLASKAATEKRTYGFRKLTIMASSISAIFLLITLGGIAWEAINRISNPKPVEGMTVIVVAAIGVLINGMTALLFVSGKKHDLNIRAAFLHMVADAAVSLGVVIAGVVIMFKGWVLADPLISLFIVVVILIGTLSLLRDSLNLSLDSVPEHIDIIEVKKYLLGIESVTQIHDLHIWAMSTTESALSVHVKVIDHFSDNDFLANIQEHLHDVFGIAHSTIQVERQDDSYCLLDKHNCV